jgi:hypothetical protein
MTPTNSLSENFANLMAFEPQMWHPIEDLNKLFELAGINQNQLEMLAIRSMCFGLGKKCDVGLVVVIGHGNAVIFLCF